MQVIKSLENENDKASKPTEVRIGAKNEKECRKLIDQFNLLRVNRFQALKEASVQNAEQKNEFQTVSSMRDRP